MKKIFVPFCEKSIPIIFQYDDIKMSIFDRMPNIHSRWDSFTWRCLDNDIDDDSGLNGFLTEIDTIFDKIKEDSVKIRFILRGISDIKILCKNFQEDFLLRNVLRELLESAITVRASDMYLYVVQRATEITIVEK